MSNTSSELRNRPLRPLPSMRWMPRQISKPLHNMNQKRTNQMSSACPCPGRKSCGRECHRESQSRHLGLCYRLSFLGGTPNYSPASLRFRPRQPIRAVWSQTKVLKDGEAHWPPRTQRWSPATGPRRLGHEDSSRAPHGTGAERGSGLGQSVVLLTELLIGIESICEAENSDQFSNKKGPDLKQPACPAAVFPINACVSDACTCVHSEAQSHTAWSYGDAASTQRPPGTDQHGLSRPSHQPRETGINIPLVGKRVSRR